MKRREHWIRTAVAEGGAPDVFGFVRTIHVVTPRQAIESGTQPRLRIEIVDGLAPIGTDQADERSRL